MDNREEEIVFNATKVLKSEKPVTKIYRIRWIMLIIYIFYVNANTIQTMQYSVIADIAVEYYQVSFQSIDWTSLIVMIVTVIFSFPGSYAVEKFGIRNSMIIGSIGTCIATWIKIVAVQPDRFWLVLLSQGLLALFQSFSSTILPKLVATWFGSNETSKGCAIGIIGTSVGYALSYLIPPLVVYRSSIEVMEQSIYYISLTFAIYSSIMTVLVILFFKNAPPLPPSIAQDNSLKEKKSNPTRILKICKNLITNRSFVLYTITNGINLGLVIATQILSNQIILVYYPNAGKDVGIIGLLQTFLSLLGTIFISILLDKYKKFKEITWISFGLYYVTILLFFATLDQGLEFVYVTSILNGISMGSLLTLTMEVVVEFTYPEPENISVGLSSNFIQIISIAYTFLYGHMFRTVGIIWANVTVLVVILASDILFFFFKFNLKRQAVQQSMQQSVKESVF